MSTNNYILNLLNIKDRNIFISEKIETRKIKGINYKVINGILSCNPIIVLTVGVSIKNIIYNNNKNISIKMRQAFKLYRDNINYIENSFKYNIDNRRVEGTNSLI